MRIVFVSYSLKCGGAERVVSHLVRRWAEVGHAVTVLTFDDAGAGPFFPLDSRVAYRPLNEPRWNAGPRSLRRYFFAVERIFRLRRALAAHAAAGETSILVSFLTYTNMVALLASAGLPFRRIVSDRSPPAADTVVLRGLRPFLYALSERIVVQTAAARAGSFPWLRRKTKVIPNPVVDLTSDAGARRNGGGGRPFVLGVGRLVGEKRFDLLIAAFDRVKDQFPEWDLKIAGDGPLREALEKQIAPPALRRRVSLLGEVAGIAAVYAEASLFVSSSTSEGFPNALCEAMAAGLPVIAANCEFGPSEIVRDGIDGRLVKQESVDALVEALKDLMGRPDLRSQFGRAAAAVSERYSPERIASTWEGLFA